jgi:hypothetical protein
MPRRGAVLSVAAATMHPMRSTSIKPGDIVYATKNGRLFHAKVTGSGADGTLLIAPIQRNISYRHITTAEIADHWAHTVHDTPPRPRPQDTDRA